MGDTIAAISTAPGEGGIGIVRVSGPECSSIMKKVFSSCPEKISPRHAYYGRVLSRDGETIDEAICLYMKAPHTYTCEDVLEIQAHGSTISLRKILRRVLEAGARMAEPGEFTKLAFLNGRIDLTQAEAVIDIIKAKSEIPFSIAEEQLAGKLGTEVTSIRNAIKDVLAQMAVNIDFPDEDIEQEEYSSLAASLRKQEEELSSLIATSDSGRIAREGIKMAIVGRPNVGKSSLMNSILGEERAIVTDIPGTTRDTIEESASIAGMSVVLVDTAGIRSTDDVIEKIGIERSKREIEESDVTVMVFDGSEPLCDEDREIAGTLSGRRVLAVINKEDKGTVIGEDDVRKLLPDCTIITTSLISREGKRAVMEELEKMMSSGFVRSDGGNVVTNERHRDALVRADRDLLSSISLLERGEPLEIAELDAHYAFDALGEIIGETAGEEILDTVFSKFCLGK
jgi:tRNA modification GTPase